MAYNKPEADLIVGYLVVQQDNAMTTYFDEYFGHGRDPDEISDAAHRKNVINGKRPDQFERAGVVVDVIDAKTYELVYRNYAAGDIVRSNNDATRAAAVTTDAGAIASAQATADAAGDGAMTGLS